MFQFSKILVDTFEGQVITGLVVLIFAVVFLIREWVLQNAALNMIDRNGNMDIRDRVFNRAVDELHVEPGNRVPVNARAEAREGEPINAEDVAALLVGDRDDIFNRLENRDQPGAEQDELRRRNVHNADTDAIAVDAQVAQDLAVAVNDVQNPAPLQAAREGGQERFDMIDFDLDLRPDIWAPQPEQVQQQQQRQPQPQQQQQHQQQQQQQQQPGEGGGFWEMLGAWFHDNVLGENEREDGQGDRDDDEFADRLAFRAIERRGEDENELDVEEEGDDLDGVLEIIGMRGPLPTLFQNGIFSTVLVTGALALSLWLPYILGKFVLLVVSHPVTIFGIFPLRFISFFANQSVDIIIVFLAYGVFGARLYIQMSETLSSKMAEHFSWFKTEAEKRVIHEAWARVSERYHGVESIFSGAGADLMKDAVSRPTWIKYIHGGVVPDHITAFDRVLAVLAGYAFLTTLGALYLSHWTKKQGRNRVSVVLEIAVADILRQAGAILKVIVIIGIELVVFPLFCGVLLDGAFLPLFDGVTAMSRWQFCLNHPFTSLFLHWFVGTCYMFHFALFVSMCREIVRPGLLYFIRDPNDPNFHPIRDVLDRPVLTQLHKIIMSALIYCSLISICLGGVVYALRYALPWRLLPLQLSWGDALTEVPINLLLYNAMVPFVLQFFKPTGLIESSWKFFFRKAASFLRLSSFIFGREVPIEQGELIYRSKIDWILSFTGRPTQGIEPIQRREDMQASASTVFFLRDGDFVRAPNSDSVHMRKGGHDFVVVNKANQRLDGVVDNAEDTKDTIAVYAPPHLRWRIAALLMGIWTYATVCGLFVSVGPLLLGREIFKLTVTPQRPINDVISFVIGAYAFCLVYLVGNFLIENRASFQERYLKLANAFGNPVQFIKQIAELYMMVGKLIYVFAALGFVIPLLVSLVIEFYIVIPLHVYFSTDQPVIHFMQSWALGVLYFRFIWKALTSRPESRLERAMTQTLQNGYAQLNLKPVSNTIIFPAVLGLSTMLLVPVPLGYLAQLTLCKSIFL